MRFGYLADELPFYYENARMQTVHTQYLRPFENGRFRTGLKTLKYVTTPTVPKEANQRLLDINIDLTDSATTVQFQLSLRGQWSTLTRNLYLHNQVDPNVPSEYHKLWWQGHDVQNVEWNGVLKRTKAPYDASIAGTFTPLNWPTSEHGSTTRWYSLTHHAS
jgi:hypothetical protein